MSIAVVAALTDAVVTAKVPVAWPAATATLAGTMAEALPLDKVTIAPPVGAAPVSVTVPVADCPPVTEAGLTASEASASEAPPAGGNGDSRRMRSDCVSSSDPCPLTSGATKSPRVPPEAISVAAPVDSAIYQTVPSLVLA